ncbi:4'-phosphopantetheinyl transferase superfamily protein [Pseudoclavibacter alba]|uniref:4'-phosphopantetheinyl transferase family protein n=1 Tax=Pseudoclavibacter albus TaxID=272241 RepID=UPI0019D0AABA|nr:4'-phosphopantetheinyl transferase superfamily protein [Pseudoclavibacter alba]MBN6777669.1 4'-phosphopantetheinyl transferase superfamily protein [Pseudoclavibacter alba]
MTAPLVHVRLVPRETVHEALVALAVQHGAPSNARLTHACPSCGSSEHGRPVLHGDGALPHVSLSHARGTGRSLITVCFEVPVGVDVEPSSRRDEVASAAEVALHRDEHPSSPDEMLRLWVRKEALLKAHGTGLATDPRSVHLDTSGHILEGPAGAIVDLTLGPDWCAAVAVLGPTPEVVVSY